MNIKKVKTENLIPYVNNAKKHPQAQIDQLAASIKEFGFNNPILTDGDNGIIAGHGRFAAAQKLGLETVPVIELAHLSDVEKKAYILADNRLAESGGTEWDFDLVALELQSLEDSGFDIDLTGFDISYLDDCEEVEFPELNSGDKEPFQQMTFTLHDDQAEVVKEAIDVAKAMGQFIDSPNENGNGNALARICETFVTQNG